MTRHPIASLCLLFSGSLVLAQEAAVHRPVPPQPVPGAAQRIDFRGVYDADGVADEAWTMPTDVADVARGTLDLGRSAVGWPMAGNVPANTYYTQAAGPVARFTTWTYSAPGAYVWRPSVAPDGTIYVCTARLSSGVDGRLVALRPNGTTKWEAPLTNSAGAGVWASATPVIDEDGNIYVAWAHDIDFGGLTALSFDSSGVRRWRYEPNIPLETASHQQPVLSDGVLYAGIDTSWYSGNPTHRASIVALDTETGNLVWRWPSPVTDTFFDGPAIGSDGAIYVASAANPSRNAHGYVSRLWPNGTLDWAYDLGPAGSNAAPALDANNDVYLGDLVGVAWKITHTGTFGWTYDTRSGRIYTTPALAEDKVLVGGAFTGLDILDAASGTWLGKLAPGYYALNKVSDRHGNIYFYCYDGPGTVLGFGRGGTQWLQATTGAGVTVNGCIVGDNGLLLVGNSQVLKAWTGRVQGDTNCDGVINFADINPFVLALSDPIAYQAQYPNCLPTCDTNGDGAVDFQDINPFVAVLSGP